MDAEKIRQAAERYNRRSTAEGWRTSADPSLVFERDVINDMVSLWAQKAKDGIPRREMFSARDLKLVLPRLGIAERVELGGGKQSWRWRLWGTGLAGMMGEYTGKLLEDVLPPEHAIRWGFTYDCAVDTPAPMRFQSNFQLSQIEHLGGETLALPLTDETGEVKLVMAVAYVQMREQERKLYG